MFQVLQIWGKSSGSFGKCPNPFILFHPHTHPPVTSAKESTMHSFPFGAFDLGAFFLAVVFGDSSGVPPSPSTWGHVVMWWSCHTGTPFFFSLVDTVHLPMCGGGQFWETSKISPTQVVGLSTYQRFFFTSEMGALAALPLGRPTDPRTPSLSTSLLSAPYRLLSGSGFQTFFFFK